MGIEKFEDIIAWQKAKEMTILIYTTFRDSKDFGLKDQIQRAGVSVMNNIAEGFERKPTMNLNSFFTLQKACVMKYATYYTL